MIVLKAFADFFNRELRCRLHLFFPITLEVGTKRVNKDIQ